MWWRRFYGVVAAVFFCAGLCSGQENVALSPGPLQYVPKGFAGNVTFSCNVSVPAGNPERVRTLWVINNRQIEVDSAILGLHEFGVFIEYPSETMATVFLNTTAIGMLSDTLIITCSESVVIPPRLTVSESLMVRTYGPPGTPSPSARVTASTPSILRWGNPPNLTDAAPVTFRVVASSRPLNLTRTYVVNRTELSLESLEGETLTGVNDCQEFNFSVVASLPDVPDSPQAVSTDIIPNSIDVGPINSSLLVTSVRFSSLVEVGLFFQVASTCSKRFPITRYRVLVDGVQQEVTVGGVTQDYFVAPDAGSVVNTIVGLGIPRDRQSALAVEACTRDVCRTSNTTILNTTDVQMAQVVFFRNNVFLTCYFAVDSGARGCVFLFDANLNASGASTNEFRVLLGSDHHGEQCNTSDNQRTGYVRFTVVDLEQDGSMGVVSLPVMVREVETEEEYREQTRCSVARDVVSNNTAVAIAVPIILVFFLALIVTGSLLYYYLYYRKHKKYQRVKTRKPTMKESNDSPDDLLLIIDNDNEGIIKEPMPPGIKPYESLPPNLRVLPDGSMRKECPPVEVELHKDEIRLRVNKTALKAVARFHMLVKKQQSDASMAGTLNSQLDKVSMMALSGRTPSRVHFSKNLCDTLTPNMDTLKEVEDEEEDLKSWAIFHYDPPADVSPPDSMTTSPMQKIPPAAWVEKPLAR